MNQSSAMDNAITALEAVERIAAAFPGPGQIVGLVMTSVLVILKEAKVR
jgi:hypothetical protein